MRIPPFAKSQDLLIGLILAGSAVSALAKIPGLASGEAARLAPVLVLHLAAGVLLVLRLPVAHALRLRDAALALPAILLPLISHLLPSRRVLSSAGGWIVLGVGFSFLLLSLFFLGRSFAVFPVARPLVTSGPFRLVRHPTYAGYLLLWIGTVLLRFSLASAAVLLLCAACLVVRILLEERRMAGPAYEEYRRDVPSRLLPGIW